MSALRKFEAEECRPSTQIIERPDEVFNIAPNEHHFCGLLAETGKLLRLK